VADQEQSAESIPSLRKLTKRRSDGRLYTRRPLIEALIAQLVTTDQAALTARLTIHDRRHSDYVPSECLIYLLREAAGGQSQRWFDALCSALMTRCALNLRWSVNAGVLRDAEGLREDIVSEFVLRISEALQHDPERLDPFEVAFDLAFSTLRTDRVRSEQSRQRMQSNFNPQPSDAEDDPDRWILALAADDGSEILGLYGAEYELFRKSVLQAITQLPAAERVAISLRLEGWQISSEERDMNSIAKHCGVDERTIRNRIRSGVKRLIALTQGDPA
jgi:DNA-directed RNA polymerase specialized sigma24 family protein